MRVWVTLAPEGTGFIYAIQQFSVVYDQNLFEVQPNAQQLFVFENINCQSLSELTKKKRFGERKTKKSKKLICNGSSHKEWNDKIE